ncbi:MAG: RsmB/NOP family class I SAM-dependent RNA methyltransferase [Lachnospiraceae bacterium]|nr:RsmB/NOP family class I SAM-dependent RNA methyltransferase [Agathobacter sp.]MDD6445554.1 RsmB/NOP family class I SAM-dependent RNA methyltransferase [Lachnospiraceae bacterium]MDY4893167.1 RsmB/NOP family class I SAM-dependent RNA methyltransferase [Agathobacter sp.]
MLPQLFQERMNRMLKDEYPAFLDSYEKERYQALRVNTLKADREDTFIKFPFHLKEILWENNGFYYEKEDYPGKHPYHEAGVYYIQEPSAMAPAAYLGAKPGEKVLDLCAAPGGKSTQIAAAMEGEGLLVSNEIHPARAKILSENIERMGIMNALVTNENPQTLAKFFIEFFDRIMVDAPCSGEGMFRKNENACEEWSLENVALCAKRQLEILECAADMLRPGGRMVYSTCTFSPEENEGTISRFLHRHPEFHVVPVKRYEGMTAGRPEWIPEGTDGTAVSGEGRNNSASEQIQNEIRDTIRLFPHRIRGEGHFVAVLEKEGVVSENYRGYCSGGIQKTITGNEGKEFERELSEILSIKLPQRMIRFGEQLYLVPEDMPSIQGLHVLRPGLHLGTIKKNRLEPAHALALAMKKKQVKHSFDLKSEGPEIRAYLSGQTFPAEGEKGWYLITVDGYSIGWGKLAGAVMKNHYPKGLRKNWNQ